MWGKNEMRDFDDYETNEVKKFMAPGSGFQALGLGQYGHIVMYLILEIFFSSIYFFGKTKCMKMISIKHCHE